MSNDSIEGKMFVTAPAPWPVTIREVSVDEARKIDDDIRAHAAAIRGAPDHIVSTPDVILSLARHVCSDEEFARVEREVEAAIAGATPIDEEGDNE